MKTAKHLYDLAQKVESDGMGIGGTVSALGAIPNPVASDVVDEPSLKSSKFKVDDEEFPRYSKAYRILILADQDRVKGGPEVISNAYQA